MAAIHENLSLTVKIGGNRQELTTGSEPAGTQVAAGADPLASRLAATRNKRSRRAGSCEVAFYAFIHAVGGATVLFFFIDDRR